MPVTDEVKDYVRGMREQNNTDDQIRTSLTNAGWSEADVTEALTPLEQPDPVPSPPTPLSIPVQTTTSNQETNHFGMWLTTQYALLFITLYFSSISLGGILHRFVDKTFPDQAARKLNSYSFFGSGDDYLMRSYVAGIIVAFPIFAFMYLKLKKLVMDRPEVKALKARKQLIYLTMVLTFLIVLVHLISTVVTFLGGANIQNAIAHLGVTLAIAGGIFIYLFTETQEDRKG